MNRPDPKELVRRGATVAPLSFAQERLWFFEQLHPDRATYNMASQFRIRGPLDVDRLARAYTTVVARHEVLRSRFESDDGYGRQVVHPPMDVPVTVVDLRGHPEVEAEWRHRVRVARTTPFDIGSPPLLRPTVFRIADDEYVLNLALHHIANDGWSYGLLHREVSECYRADLAGRAPELPALPIQYGDFAAWQRESHTPLALRDQLDFWTRELDGYPTVLELPTDRPRPPVQPTDGADYQYTMPPDLIADLRVLARRQRCTLFMVVLSAVQVLLGRYCGTERFLIGVPTAGRGQPALEQLIGFFVGVLPLRADLTGDPTFVDVLRRVRRAAVSAYDNADVPFEQLVDELRPPRTLARTALVQVMCQMFEDAERSLVLPGLDITGESAGNCRAKQDLSLQFTGRGDHFAGLVVYPPDLFDAATVRRLIANLIALLRAVVADPTSRIAELSIMDEAERELVVSTWNDTADDFGDHRCLHEIFTDQAARTPDLVAVRRGEDSITYAELDRRSNRLAHLLVEHGVGPETPVGVCLDRSIDLVVSVLAVLKAGGAYVPLEPGYPPRWLASLLADCRAPVLIGRRDTVGDLTAQILLDDDIPAALPDTPLPNRVTQRNLAYVIYTSGSTGAPKGVATEHRSVVNRLHWMWREYPYADGEVACLKTAISFVDSVAEIFGPLLAGHTTIAVPADAAMDPDRLVDVLAAERVGRIMLVPSLLRAILDTCDTTQLTDLRLVICGGEVLTSTLADEFAKALPHATLLNMYGASETTVDITWHAARPGDRDGAVPVGRPETNNQVHVLDEHFRPVPIGVVGTIYVGGANVVRGYHGRPDLTADRFVPDPFGAPGARLYHTGDSGRFRPDGVLEFVERTASLVKVRGARVEIAHVERTIRAHPDVGSAVVVAAERGLFAYYVGGAVGEPRLRGWVGERLPDYMIPTRFVALPELRLLPNGKVDRRSLPDPSRVAAAPVAETEGTGVLTGPLADVCMELLGVPTMHRGDNFFTLGGDSLTAVRLVAKMRAAGVFADLRDVFRCVTLDELADCWTHRTEGVLP